MHPPLLFLETFPKFLDYGHDLNPHKRILTLTHFHSVLSLCCEKRTLFSPSLANLHSHPTSNKVPRTAGTKAKIFKGIFSKTFLDFLVGHLVSERKQIFDLVVWSSFVRNSCFRGPPIPRQFQDKRLISLVEAAPSSPPPHAFCLHEWSCTTRPLLSYFQCCLQLFAYPICFFSGLRFPFFSVPWFDLAPQSAFANLSPSSFCLPPSHNLDSLNPLLDLTQ